MPPDAFKGRSYLTKETDIDSGQEEQLVDRRLCLKTLTSTVTDSYLVCVNVIDTFEIRLEHLVFMLLESSGQSFWTTPFVRQHRMRKIALLMFC